MIADLLQTEKEHIVIEHMNTQLQKSDDDGGLFAIAAATALCYGEDHVDFKYEKNLMRTHLCKAFEIQALFLAAVFILVGPFLAAGFGHSRTTFGRVGPFVANTLCQKWSGGTYFGYKKWSGGTLLGRTDFAMTGLLTSQSTCTLLPFLNEL